MPNPFPQAFWVLCSPGWLWMHSVIENDLECYTLLPSLSSAETWGVCPTLLLYFSYNITLLYYKQNYNKLDNLPT